ncbi:MAG TPA: hypothetical protein VJ302_26280 [Blastocatellia bacterium]|nr:hypothetical protein [Blastocatellia bacterium]
MSMIKSLLLVAAATVASLFILLFLYSLILFYRADPAPPLPPTPAQAPMECFKGRFLLDQGKPEPPPK